MVTYVLDAECGDCEWEGDERITRREADIGEPSASEAVSELRMALEQDYPECPECGGEVATADEPRIGETTTLSDQ
jgi:hypothetical protein